MSTLQSGSGRARGSKRARTRAQPQGAEKRAWFVDRPLDLQPRADGSAARRSSLVTFRRTRRLIRAVAESGRGANESTASFCYGPSPCWTRRNVWLGLRTAHR
jgi:hypothetical protein